MRAYGVVCYLRTARQAPVVYVTAQGVETVNVRALFRSAAFSQGEAGMSKKVTFSCDFCRDELPPHDLVGFVWQGGERRWKIVGHESVDFPHVCQPCASALVREIMASAAFPSPEL